MIAALSLVGFVDHCEVLCQADPHVRFDFSHLTFIVAVFVGFLAIPVAFRESAPLAMLIAQLRRVCASWWAGARRMRSSNRSDGAASQAVAPATGVTPGGRGVTLEMTGPRRTHPPLSKVSWPGKASSQGSSWWPLKACGTQMRPEGSRKTGTRRFGEGVSGGSAL